MNEPLSDEELAELLGRLDDLAEIDPNDALREIRKLPEIAATEPEIRLLNGSLRWQTQGASVARALLERLVEDEPDFADAHYTLGLVCEELGDSQACSRHFLEVLAIDTDADNSSGFDATQYESSVVEAAEETLASLPSPFDERLAGVPILVEDRPQRDLVRSGFDPRALGLFEGPNDAQRSNGDAAERPTRIVLYVSNLLAMSETPEELAEQVEVTVLHEVGHYFGLDEEDLERLGLD